MERIQRVQGAEGVPLYRICSVQCHGLLPGNSHYNTENRNMVQLNSIWDFLLYLEKGYISIARRDEGTVKETLTVCW